MTEEMTEYQETKCFSYEVVMVVQVIAKDQETAREQLDKSGGYVSRRSVELKDAVSLFSGTDPQEQNGTDI
jgi:hypothetical protein